MGGPHWQSKTATHGAREGAVARACRGLGFRGLGSYIYIYIYMLTPQLARTSSEDVSSLLQSVAGKLLFVRHQLSIFVDAGIKVLMFL